MIVAFVCTKCGAPLPREAAGEGFVTCEYCGTTHHVHDGSAKEVRDGTPTAAALRAEQEVQRKRKFIAELQERMKAGASAYDAITSSARENLGPIGQTDAIARVAIALAEDFDGENGTKVTKDGIALSRIVEAYIKACYELRSVGRTEMNLPFLSAASDGPKHFLRDVTAADFAKLAQRPPRAPEPEPPPEPEPEPPKKKGWWPF